MAVVLFLAGLILLGIASYPFMIGAIDTDIARSHLASGYVPVAPAPPDGPVEFGTGGAGCILGSSSTTFTVRDQIRFVGRLAKPVVKGAYVSITLMQGDWPQLQALPGYPTSVTLGTGAACVSQALSLLAPGRYQVVLFISSNDCGPLCHSTELLSEFDVTP